MKRFRTVEQAYQEIIKLDPETAISKRLVKDLVYSGEVPSIKVGVKHLVDLDCLIEYLDQSVSE